MEWSDGIFCLRLWGYEKTEFWNIMERDKDSKPWCIPSPPMKKQWTVCTIVWSQNVSKMWKSRTTHLGFVVDTKIQSWAFKGPLYGSSLALHLHAVAIEHWRDRYSHIQLFYGYTLTSCRLHHITLSLSQLTIQIEGASARVPPTPILGGWYHAPTVWHSMTPVEHGTEHPRTVSGSLGLADFCSEICSSTPAAWYSRSSAMRDQHRWRDGLKGKSRAKHSSQGSNAFENRWLGHVAARVVASCLGKPCGRVWSVCRVWRVWGRANGSLERP